MHRAIVLAMLVSACGGATPLDGAHLHARPDAIDLGFADCGGATPSGTFVLENDGTAPLDVTATPDPRLTLDQTHFFVDAHGSITVSVTGLAAAKDAHAGESTTASIHVTTNDPASSAFDVAVTATTHGAELAVVPPQIDLGLIPVPTTSPPHGFAIVNTGNADVDIALSQPNPDFTVTLDTLHVAADTTVQGAATFFASAPGATKVSVSIDAKGVLCGDVSNLDVLANGSEGTFGVSPGYLDFGAIYCGHAAKPKTITLLNGGNAPYSFNATFAAGTGFHVTPSSGVVKTSLELTITPLPIPANATPGWNLYGDTLVIKTNIPDDVPHEVPVSEGARGAVLHFSSAIDSFGKTQVGQDVTHHEYIFNDGTYENLSFASAASGDFTLTGSTYQWSYGSVDVTFHPQPSLLGEKESATFTLDVTGPMCAPVPSITVDATNHDLAYSVVALEDATCADSAESSARVYCWGRNEAGQLGTSSPSGSLTPRPVPISTSFGRGLGGGGTFVFYGAGTGSLQYWGTVNGVTSAPTTTYWSGDYASASSFAACFSEGGMACFGRGGYLGDGTTNDSMTPVFVTGYSSSVVSSGADGHTCAGTQSGVICWGPDDWGQIGDGTTRTQNVLAPYIVPGSNPFGAVAAGDGFTCASGPTVSCWGRNTSSECGTTASSSPELAPTSINAGGNAWWVTAGRDFVCALVGSNVVCWGSNARGQLGDGGNETISAPPVTVGLAGTWGYYVRAGGHHACVPLAGGRVQCWGSNTYGELGDATTSDAPTPVFVKGFD